MVSTALHPRDIEGKHFTHLFYRMCNYQIDVTAPDNHHLLNFIVDGVSENDDKVSLLFLDPYGDDTLPDGIRERVFGKTPYSVAIDREAGDICIVSAFPRKRRQEGMSLHVERWTNIFLSDGEQYKIPARWRNRLDELLSKKRPYRCHIEPGALEQFVDREIGYDHLRHNVVFSFDFDDDGLVEVWGESHRFVEHWRIS